MKILKIALVILILAALFFWRWQSVTTRDFIFQNDIGKEVSFEAEIIDEPVKGQQTMRLVLSLENSRERVLATVESYPEYTYGDRILVKGKIEEPENFETDAGKEFDYVNYLRKERIYYQMFRPRVELISEYNGNWLREKLFALKNWFLNNVAQVIPEPESSLAGGLVVGARGMDKDIEDAFRQTGLSHIVVLSGQNLSIIADAVIRSLGFLSFRLSIMFGGIFVILFALLAGGGASVLRATIMAVISLVARLTGRIYDTTRALILAVILMSLWNPLSLVYDIGFHLSILATLGIIYGTPLMGRVFSFVPERFQLREIVSTSLSAQIAVLPWVTYKIGMVSVVAPLVNLLALPLVPLVMFLVFLTGITAWIPIISLPFAWLAHLGLWWIISLATWFAKLPFASFTISSLSLIFVLFAYSGLIYLIFYGMRQGWYNEDIIQSKTTHRE